MRKALLALALLFLLAHAACLPATFADVDSINFALGIRDFDVSKHQPHPPGYPVFMAAAKASAFLAGTAGLPAPEARGLSFLSAIAGALLIPLLFLFFRELVADRRVAAWAAVVTALSPLFWFNALRPLSDMTGLTAIVLAQTLLVAVILGQRSDIGTHSPQPRAPRPEARLILGALVAGVAIGVRAQSFVLTLPLLALALLTPRAGIRLHGRIYAAAALAAGVLLWLIPLLIASGGLDAYLTALRNQAGEDFTGVVMLWTMRSARVAIDAIKYSVLWPWGTVAAGWIVVGVTVAGAIRMALRAPSALGVLVVAFAPYAAFHVLFQETLTTRYALPLVIPMGLLAVYALAGAGRTVLHVGAVALVSWSMWIVVPAERLFGERPSPPYRALQEALAASGPDGLVAMHAVMLRVEQFYHGNASGRVVRALHGQEVPGLVERWTREPDRVVTFIADRRRSDLAMLDPRSRALVGDYVWGFPELSLLGGTRPGEARVFTLRPPDWMLGPGWALTAEIGGQTERAAAGPHRRPAVAWVRSRAGASTMMIGGRNLGPQGSAPARITVSMQGHPLDSWIVPPGFFFETRALAAGSLDSRETYLPVDVSATSTTAEQIRVSLEQFDLQQERVPMAGLVEGWQEPEYDPTSGRTWRWMTDRATVWVRSVGRDVTLRLSAESPMRYYDRPPLIRFTVGGTVLSEIVPAADFTHEVKIPAALLAAGNERLVIESDRSFVPGKGDLRTLALRVYAIEVN